MALSNEMLSAPLTEGASLWGLKYRVVRMAFPYPQHHPVIRLIP